MNKLVYLLERTLNSRSKKLTKQDEYMFYSPFVSHYKPKLQINIVSQKWHCWVSNQGDHCISTKRVLTTLGNEQISV